MAQTRVERLAERKRQLIELATEHRTQIAASFRELDAPLSLIETGASLALSARSGLGAVLTMGAMAVGRKAPVMGRVLGTMAGASGVLLKGLSWCVAKVKSRRASRS